MFPETSVVSPLAQVYAIPDPTSLLNPTINPQLTDPETNLPIIELSYSSLNEIRNCPRKYQIRKRFYQPDYQLDNEFLSAASGTAIHEYIQSRLRGETHDQASFAFFKSYSFLAEETSSDYDLRFRSLEPSYHTAVSTWDKLGISSDDLATFDLGDGQIAPGTEFKFSIRLHKPGWKHVYIFRGAIDLAIRSNVGAGHEFIAADIKTHRNTTPDLTPNYKFSTQLVPYGLVIQHLTGNPITSFSVTYYSIFVDLISPEVTTYPFQKTGDDITAWLQSILLTIANIETYAEQPIWPRSQNGCVSFNRPCRYFQTCPIHNQQELQKAILADGRYPPKTPHSMTPHVNINLEL